MAQTGKTTSQKKENPAKSKAHNADDPLELNKSETKTADAATDLNPERLRIIEEITDLFGNEDISDAVKKFNADSEEKEIALEFANSHVQFFGQIVESDSKKGISRSDAEIRDIVSNVNVMLMKKDEYLFTTIVTHSPSHYRNIQKKYYAEIKKQEDGKEGK